MSNEFKKSDVLKCMKQMQVVSTKSGPVEPARGKVINMMTKQILKGVAGDQTKDQFDNRKYELNDDLLTHKHYLTADAIAKKAVTEMVSTPASQGGIRMDIRNINAAKEHSKFVMNRRGRDVNVEVFYPNQKQNITLSINIPDLQESKEARKVFEISPDSYSFKKGFGETIIKTIDMMANKAEQDLNTSNFLTGEGALNPISTDVSDLETSLLAPSAMVQESVDWRLASLKGICDKIVMEADEEFSEADFNADGGAGDAPVPGGDMAGSFNDGMDGDGTVDPAAVNGDGEASDDMDSFRNFAEQHFETLQGGIFDKLATIVADCEYRAIKDSSSGIKPSRSDVENGYKGVKNETPSAILNAFLEFFPELDTELPVKQLNELAEYLANNFDSVNEFKLKLADIFPDLYDKSGNPVNAVADDITKVGFGDDFDSTGSGLNNPDEQLDLSGVMNDNPMGGGNDFNDFLDNANAFGGAEDTFGTENGDESEDIDIPELPNI